MNDSYFKNYFTKQTKPDTYYHDKSKEAIEKAVADSKAKGKTPEEIRQELRNAYPFGPERTGRAYKVWRKVMLAKEKELGYEPKTHKKGGQCG